MYPRFLFYSPAVFCLNISCPPKSRVLYISYGKVFSNTLPFFRWLLFFGNHNGVSISGNYIRVDRIMYSYGNYRSRIFIFEKEQAFSLQYSVYPIPRRVLFCRALMLRIEVRGIVSTVNTVPYPSV